MEDLINVFEVKSNNIFNSPLEIGLRSLFILNSIYPADIDLNRLSIYDYFALNSEDFPNGPESLHPKIPHRGGQIIIRPLIMKKALDLMNSKELIDILFTSRGVLYKANELTKKFTELFDDNYSGKLKDITIWLNNEFKSFSDSDLNLFVKKNIPSWGSEFIYESLIRNNNE